MGFILLTQYCSGGEIEKNELGWACSTNGVEEMGIEGIGEEMGIEGIGEVT